MNKKSITIAVDMYGCPNRCRHCWLSHMPNATMEDGADKWIVDSFRQYFEKIEFYSWLREPDFCKDYRDRWEKDKQLSVNAQPQRFELGSFWRLVRDPEYVLFLKDVGVSCVQLTLFGLKETTDRYVGREGAFEEILKATEILIEHEISPRWQTFINEENKDEIVQVLKLTEDLKLKERVEAFGGTFKFFVHPGSCDGENRKLYPVRINKGHVPDKLIPYFLNYEKTYSEKELCEKLKNDTSSYVPHNDGDIVIYVANDYDLFFNFTHMQKEWRIGNLKTDPKEELVRRILDEDFPALRSAREITVSELVTLYGNPESERLFEEDDFKMHLLNTYLEYESVSLETPDLILKKAKYEDWEPLYRNLWSHSESAKYMLWNVTSNEEDAKARILRTIDFEKKEKYGLIVYLKSTMEAIGFACMREAEPFIYEETGIAVGPDYVRRGYGRQILTALCDEAKRVGAKEFRASYRKMNAASKGMIEACGFEFDFESEEKTDPRNGEKYTVVNCKKILTMPLGQPLSYK